MKSLRAALKTALPGSVFYVRVNGSMRRFQQNAGLNRIGVKMEGGTWVDTGPEPRAEQVLRIEKL